MSAMDEWQKRMKAEKDAERQKKSESADMLRGYRGGDLEEAKKLKAAKDEERRLKEEAQRALQDYKGNDMEELKKLKAMREEEQRRKLEAQSQLHDYKAKELDELGVQIKRSSHHTHNQQQQILIPVNANRENDRNDIDLLAEVSVSERAAALAKLAMKSDSIPLPSEYLNGSKRELFGNSSKSELFAADVPNDNSDSIVASDSEVQVGTTVRNELVLTSTINNGEPYVTNSTSLESIPLATDSVGDTNPKSNDKSLALSEQGMVLSKETGSEAAKSIIEGINPQQQQAETPSQRSAEYEDEKKSEYCSQFTSKASYVESVPSPPEYIRVDVLFSFGLVTVQVDPVLDAYLDAVEKVVEEAITSDPDLAKKVTYDRNYRPFVRSTQWDSDFKSKSGRPDVKRMVVTAGAPVFLNHSAQGVSISETRTSVVEALTAAIQTGSFLAIARSKK